MKTFTKEHNKAPTKNPAATVNGTVINEILEKDLTFIFSSGLSFFVFSNNDMIFFKKNCTHLNKCRPKFVLVRGFFFYLTFPATSFYKT